MIPTDRNWLSCSPNSSSVVTWCLVPVLHQSLCPPNDVCWLTTIFKPELQVINTLFCCILMQFSTQQNQKRLKPQAFKFNLKFQRTLRLKHIVACRYLAEPVGPAVSDSGPQHVAVGLHRFSETETAKAILASHTCQQSQWFTQHLVLVLVYFLLVCVGRKETALNTQGLLIKSSCLCSCLIWPST